MTTNRTVLDLTKVQHGTFYWENQYGHRREKKPNATYLGQTIPQELVNRMNFHALDQWHELVVFQLTANHSIMYKGKKARALWQAWCERIFSKQMKQEMKKK